MLVLVGVIELFARQGWRAPSVVVIVLAGLVAATIFSGLVAGLVSGAIGFIYNVWYDHVFGSTVVTGTPIYFAELLLIILAMVIMPALLRRWSINLAREHERRRQANAAAQRFAALLEGLDVVVWQTDRSLGRFTFISPKAEKMFGHSIDRWRADDGVTFYLGLVDPEDRDRISQAWHSDRTRPEDRDLAYRVLSHDGSRLWIRDLGQSTPGSADSCSGVLVDITGERETEQQLVALNETLEKRVERRTRQLRSLAVQLSQAEQQERRRVAQLLHDGLQQILVAGKMRLGVLSQKLKDPRLREIVEGVVDLLERAIMASRSLTTELVPPVLYDGGLIPALQWLKRWVEQEYGLHVSVDTDRATEPESEDLRLMLFQAARELLLNVVKHAGVDTVQVTLRREEAHRIRLVIEDQGTGFVHTSLSKGDEAHFGLFHIRVRIEAIGGSMEISSVPGQGTRVTLVAPSNEGES